MVILLALLLLAPACFGQSFTVNDPAFGPAPATTATTLLLDSTTNTAKAAYSTSRKLRAAYSGNAFKVRRASDNTTQDIGFSGNDVDVSALTTFVGATNGYVQVWYDQSGNGINLTNDATSKDVPITDSSGTVYTGNDGKPAMYILGDGTVNLSAGISLNLPVDWFVVFDNISMVSVNVLVSGGSTTRLAFKQLTGGNRMRLDNGGATADDATAISTGTWYVGFQHCETGASDFIRINANSSTVANAGDNTLALLFLGYVDSTSAEFKISEWVIYNQPVIVADETTSRNNINTHYLLF